LRLALSKGHNRVGVSLHLRTETVLVSEISCFSSNYLESGRWTKSENPVILCIVYSFNYIKNILFSLSSGLNLSSSFNLLVSVTNLIESDSVRGTTFSLSPHGPQCQSVSEERLPLNYSWFSPVPSNRYQNTTALSLVNFKCHSYPSVSFLVES
jgi:hypothetical protein